MSITGKPLSDLILIFWFFSAVFDYLDFAYIWQLKEYRLDLFRDFLKTKQGAGFLRGYRIFWRSIFAMAVFTFLRDSFQGDIYRGVHVITIVILSVDIIYNFTLYHKKRFRRPVPTKKALIIIFISLFFEASVLFITRQLNILLLLLVFRFVIISGIVVAFFYPTKLIKTFYIKRATKKILSYPKLRRIGVTGSYGKTTVKVFLSHILETKYNTVHTPKNINTEIGVAKFILSHDFSDDDVFICEMGAYKKGEIKLIADMVKPEIGILTAINEQHLSIFGTIEDTVRAKFELIDSLPKNGLAVLNIDNPHIRKNTEKIQSKFETYGCDSDHEPDCLITDVNCKALELNASYSYRGDNLVVHAKKVCGEHNAHNLAACIITASHLGLSNEEITKGIKHVELPAGTLNIFDIGKSTIIDDSYNSNPDGFQSALYTMSGLKSDRKRIVVTRGMQELGDRSEYLHEKIGGEIAYTADELIIIKPDHASAMKAGVGDKFNTTVREIYDFQELESYIENSLGEGVVLLIENRLPPHIHKKIISLVKHEK